METKNLLNKKITQWLLLVAMLVGCSANAWADSADGAVGIYLYVNGSHTWYRINNKSWGLNCNDSYKFDNATQISGQKLGTVTSLRLDGVGAVGNVSYPNWVGAKVVWKVDSGSEHDYKIGNYGNPSWGSADYICGSGNQIHGKNNSTDVNILSGISVGEHTLTFSGNSQNLYKNNDNDYGTYNNMTISSVSATFTVPGFTDVSESTLEFEDTKVGSSSESQDVTFTMYGSTIKLTTSSLTDFTVSKTDPTDSGESGSVTVTFKPTTTGDKSETLTLTDNYGKTTSITLKGKGIPACTPPTIDSTTPGSRCGAGTVTIEATASAGTVKWYDEATGGTSLGSGDSFTTPSISETTTYYAEADDNGCVSTSRTEVVATVNSIPTITANDNSICGAGDVTLTATPSSGASVDWYDSSTGDNKVAENTTSLTVQGVTVGSPVTRYAEAVKNGCKSSSRAQAVATAKLIPAVSNIALTGSGECGTGDVTFTATATASSTVTWYDGSTSKGTDNPITINIAGGSSKTLTAKATLDGCEESTGMSEEGSRKAAPAISASTTNTTAYEVITLSTNLETEVTWSRDVVDTKAYFVKDNQAVDGDTVDAVSVNFKAPAKGSAYTITAKNKNNDCTSNLNITIGEPQEVCN